MGEYRSRSVPNVTVYVVIIVGSVESLKSVYVIQIAIKKVQLR